MTFVTRAPKTLNIIRAHLIIFRFHIFIGGFFGIPIPKISASQLSLCCDAERDELETPQNSKSKRRPVSSMSSLHLAHSQ